MTKPTTHSYQLRSATQEQEATVSSGKKTERPRKKRAPPRRRGQSSKPTKKVTFAPTPPPLRRVDSFGTLSSCTNLTVTDDGNKDIVSADAPPAPGPAPLRYDIWGTLSTLTTLPETEDVCAIPFIPPALPEIPYTPSHHGDAKGMWGDIEYWRVQVAETSQGSHSGHSTLLSMLAQRTPGKSPEKPRTQNVEVRKLRRNKGKGKQRADSDFDVEMSEVAETEAPYEEDTLNEYSLDKGDADIPARVSPPAELDVPMQDGFHTPPRPVDWEDTWIIDTSTPTLNEWRRTQGRSSKPIVFPVILGAANHEGSEYSFSGDTEIIEN